ncbi:hypothetical protein P7K49_013929, partial [Saguinus oedipus]
MYALVLIESSYQDKNKENNNRGLSELQLYSSSLSNLSDGEHRKQEDGVASSSLDQGRTLPHPAEQIHPSSFLSLQADGQ